MELLSKEETIALREKYIGSSCQLFFAKDPLKIVRAKEQYMFDERGNAFLDCINNVAHVGHCHPAVVKAGCDQMALLSTNNRFLHDNIGICAENLVNSMPEELSVCFFVNSGSEANDLALRLAQIHTGNKDVITIEQEHSGPALLNLVTQCPHVILPTPELVGNLFQTRRSITCWKILDVKSLNNLFQRKKSAYHGHLTSLIDISHYKFNLPGGTGQKDHVHVAPSPDSYRGRYRDSDYSQEEIGYLYAKEIQDICKGIKEDGKGVCAFIIESLISCGGQILLPPNYLREVYKSVRAAGGVCIADEVQVGFGRVGKHWWAYQLQGDDVVPDIVTVGKPMGNGHPVAAVITTKAIADSFKRTGVEYFNTYGGNPVSCAIANAVMDTIKKEKLREHALEVGNHLLSSCKNLQKKHLIIGDVRGVGLFVGIELVTDRVKRIPAKEIASYVVYRMKQEHVLISSDGPDCNVLKFKPPMVFTKQNVDHVVAILDRVLSDVMEISELSAAVEKEVILKKESLMIEASMNSKIKSI